VLIAHVDLPQLTGFPVLVKHKVGWVFVVLMQIVLQAALFSTGERYIPLCEQALLMLDQVRQNMKDDLDSVDGELRIALSSDLGPNLVTPWLDEFMETYPKVSLRANISDSNIDFYRDSVDIALRYGSPNDANLYGFKICNVPRLLCATQAYLGKNRPPNTLMTCRLTTDFFISFTT
jgi:DNA-binding transcriptional LysR family regulator